MSLARATDKRQGPPLVALKRPHRHLSNDKIFLTMIVDEARLASAIQHPNVVREMCIRDRVQEVDKSEARASW